MEAENQGTIRKSTSNMQFNRSKWCDV